MALSAFESMIPADTNAGVRTVAYTDEQLLTLVTTLAARIDGLTWVTGALLQSHPSPAAVLAAWRSRQADAADGGFEIEAPEYREKFLRELQLWTATLEAEVNRRK
ncbi:MAG TPA: hypothetical protein VD865_02855 [Stenotrophomonas sp.]|nr:hypothetical protein [Stenotrophomonas sp.]